MLMCVKYKVVSVCYIFGLLLITASCTVCTSLFVLFFSFIEICTIARKESQKVGGSKPIHLFAEQSCLKHCLKFFFFKANLKYVTLQTFYVKTKTKKTLIGDHWEALNHL